MKKTIVAALFVVLTIVAQTATGKGKTAVWDHPATEENNHIEGYFGCLLEITSVEFTNSETRVMMHVSYRSENWVRFASSTYLKADG